MERRGRKQKKKGSRGLLCWSKQDEEDGMEAAVLQEAIERLENKLKSTEEDKKRLENKLKSAEEDKKRLENKLKSAEAENKDLRLRLSQMASERMRKENPCIEDLNDRHRPTALAEKWTSLFKSGEYWTTYAQLQSHGLGDDTKISNTLYRVCETVYSTCIEELSQVLPTVQVVWPEVKEDPVSRKGDVQQQLDGKISNLENRLKSLLPDSDVDTKELRSSIKAAIQACQSELERISVQLKEPITKLLKPAGVPKPLQERVLKAIDDSDVGVESADVETFAQKLLELCYRMRLHDIPMAASFHSKPGSNFDPSLLETEGGAEKSSSDAKIKCVLRPPLLRKEGGAVLSKGEVELEPEREKPVTTKKSSEKSTKKEAATEASSEESSPKQGPATPQDPKFTPPNVPKTTVDDQGNTKSALLPPLPREEERQVQSKGKVELEAERKLPVSTEKSSKKSMKKDAAIEGSSEKLSSKPLPTTRHDHQSVKYKTTVDEDGNFSTTL